MIFYIFAILLTGFFPYVTFISFGSDLQPWNFIFVFLVTLFLFYFNIKFYNAFKFLFIPIFLAFPLVLLSSDLFSAIRSFIGYCVIGFTPIVFYYILAKKYEFFIQFLKISTIVYFLVAVIQIFYSTSFLNFLVNRMSTAEDRGVASLATEPTFYGIVCVFLILIFTTIEDSNKNKYIIFLLFQIIFLAQSSMSILFLIIFMLLYIVFKANLNIKILFVVSLMLLGVFISNTDIILGNVRFFNIVKLFSDNFTDVFYVDGSLNDRLSAIYFSFKGGFDNYGLPLGFDAHTHYLTQELPKQSFFWEVSIDNRIMSYYGAIFFELGLLGMIIPITYTYLIAKAYKNKIQDILLYATFLHLILLTAIPLAFPFVGMYMATLLYNAKHETLNNP